MPVPGGRHAVPRGKTPLVTDPVRIVTQQDPDIASLTARLGLRGMRYVSFGNRPIAAMPPQPAQVDPAPAPAGQMDASPPTAVPADAVPHAAVPGSPAMEAATAAASFAAAPAPRPADYPLIAAALGRSAAPQAKPADAATLVFLGLRATQGR